jgi:two-component system OmpR family response regulator
MLKVKEAAEAPDATKDKSRAKAPFETARMGIFPSGTRSVIIYKILNILHGGEVVSMPKVLVVDDEEKIAKMVGSYLEASGYEALLAFGGEEGLARAAAERPDCVILDVSMPGPDGLEVARRLRASSSVPIIFLSARAEEIDKVLGLEIGGDDYVTKPFSPRELVSRVKAVLRRTAAPAGRGPAGREAEAEAPLRCGDLEVDTSRREARLGGRAIELTTVQFDILAFLMRRPGRVYSRMEILEGAAGIEYEGYERTLDAHVKNLRKALGDDPDAPRYIGTVRGVGYKFVEPRA